MLSKMKNGTIKKTITAIYTIDEEDLTKSQRNNKENA